MNGSCKFFRESSKPNAVERQGACNDTVHKPIIKGQYRFSLHIELKLQTLKEAKPKEITAPSTKTATLIYSLVFFLY